MNLSNQELEKSLTDTLKHIKDNDEDVEQYLIPEFLKLELKDQESFIKYIQKNHPKHNFLNKISLEEKDCFKIIGSTPENLKNQQKFVSSQNNTDISLEDFNISLQEISFDEKQNIVDDWLSDMQNKHKLRKLIPLYFNVIKSQEPSQKILSLLQKNHIQKEKALNMKAMFQILYNNSNNELQQMLLKLWSENNPLPLLYNPQIDQAKSSEDLLCLNQQLNFIFPQCFPIINFSLSKQQSSFGKTSLINKVFYKNEIFEVNDTCKLNQNTIDIMFDFCFSGSRNLAIADVHGIIPLDILIKILPLFKLCIIQMNSEDELQENLEQFQRIKQHLQKLNPECCFIIRNSKTKDNNQLNQLEIDMKTQGISIHKIIDLTQKGLEQQKIDLEIEQFSQFIFGKLKDYKSNLSNSQEFLTILKNYYGINHPEIVQIQKDNQLLGQLMYELQKFINDPSGFYSYNAFPMRSIMWQIQNNKQQQFQLDESTRDQQTKKVESIRAEISRLEGLIPNTKTTLILDLFQQIFNSKDYYNLYLKFIEQLRQLNEQNTSQLQKENQKILEELQLKKQTQNQNQNVTDINNSIKQLKKQLEQNLKTIELRKIGIELFWRELIQIKQNVQSAQLEINPAQIVANMVKKGEPFEFLDGDQLQIDQKFLVEFIKNFSDSDEKVLVLSILGTYSSGKSTILNKIFGCHFQTSVGRCTKGIYLQLLKITQQSQFDSQFDYILILDTEGLQNPNKSDPEFDKKIVLFILAISDIILINVKVHIHSQFKNLVEMCIFTLGQMKNCISSVKQISWCFNQNNDCQNFAPFLQQIQSIVNNLNLQINKTEDKGDNSSFDYNKVLDLKKENIKILGFAQTEQSQRINSNTGMDEEWRQFIVNETFSVEAYNFGVQIIKQFVRKLNTQQENSLPSLLSFFQNVESHWQSICEFPDLLQYTDLLLLKQDQSMKNKYEQLLGKQKFDYETKIPKKISEKVQAEKNTNLEFFNILEKQEKQLIQQDKEQIQQQIVIELQKYKAKNQIQNQICKKYIKLLEDYLQTYEYICHITLLDEIKKHEREFQQRKGFTYLDNLAEKISQNEEELQKLKKNKDLIHDQFNQIWTKIISDAKQQQEQVFQDYSEAQYQAIYSTFTQYQQISQNSEDCMIFLQKMSKSPPKKKNYEENSEMLNIFNQETQTQEQFQIIQNTQEYIKYRDIFLQPLSDRFRRSDCNQIADLKNYYKSNCSYYTIPIENFKQYLQNQNYSFYQDFNQFLKEQKTKYQNIVQDKEKIINQILNQFFSILDYCLIIYNKKKLDELTQYLANGNKWYQWGDKTKNYFIEFIKTFELNKIIDQVIKQPEFTINISNYYPSLKLQQTQFYYINDQDYKKQLKNHKQNVLFLINHKFEPIQHEHFETFSYISDQQANSNLLQKYNSQILQQFSEIMIKCDGWQRIYSQIYDIIKSKMIKNENKNKKVDRYSENEEILIFDNYLIKQIMANIEQKILEYNKQFANFGIILSLNGESLIYYYSMFVIWRFLCSSKWKLLERNLEQLDQMKQEQLNRFVTTIYQNTTEQSILNAIVLAKSIKKGFLDRFYTNKLDKVQLSIEQISMNCSEYVQKLDQRLLENYQKAKQSKIQDSEILDYILDQKRYIENSVDKLIKEKEQELKQNYEYRWRQKLNILLKQVFNNISIIYNITCQQTMLLKSEDYFQVNDDDLKKQDYKKEDYDYKLFLLICQCIQGEKLKKEQIQSINKEQKEIFIQNYELIKYPILEKILNQQEKRIPILKIFIQELYRIFQEEVENSSIELQIVRNSKVQEHLNKVKLNLIGCLHSCPLCKRKCDQQFGQNHKHSCQNGHQLRGMNGVLINNQPSLFTCEEIDDDSLIQTTDSTIQKKWSDIKKAYSDWNFKNLNNQKIIELKEKMINIWNSGLGELVCQQLSKKLKVNIQFQIKSDFNQVQSESVHYIIMLDDSGSMKGKQWENAQNGALQCMKEMAKNGQAKVSVIIFNNEARVVIDCERVKIDEQKDLINFNGGGTSFNNAFLKAYDQLKKYVKKDFDKIIILFYTDGEDSYPADAAQKFCYLPENIQQSLQLISCAEGDINKIASLVQLTDNFNKSGISAKLMPNIDVKDLKKVWVEVVNQNYHNIRF